MGAEVDLGGGEGEGGGLGVGGEEDGAGADGPVGLGEAVVGGDVEAVKLRVMWQVAPGARILVVVAARGQSLEDSAKV